MSSNKGSKRPPIVSRFQRGQSGNPKGRPRSQPAATPSASAVLERIFTATQNGQQRELSIAEAVHSKLFQDAIAGNRSAQRQILKMIVARENWIAAHAPKEWVSETAFEEDPENANDALLALGIAEHDPGWGDPEHDRLILRPWAVQAAISRPGGKPLSGKDIDEVKRCTRDTGTLRWPGRRR